MLLPLMTGKIGRALFGASTQTMLALNSKPISQFPQMLGPKGHEEQLPTVQLKSVQVPELE